MKKYIALIVFLLLSFQLSYAAFPVSIQKQQKKENIIHRQIEKIKTLAKPEYYGRKSGNGAMATISLVSGLVGLFVAGIILGAGAIVCGIIGLTNNRPHQGRASWGLALGLVDLLLTLVYVLKH